VPIVAVHEMFPSHGNHRRSRVNMSWTSKGWSPSGSPMGHWSADTITGLEDGDPVGTWPDQSGNGNDLTQATAAKKPLYKVNIQNGKPAVLFDGSDDNMSGSGTHAQPNTFFSVIKLETAVTSKVLTDGVDSRNTLLTTGGAKNIALYAETAVVATDFSANTITHLYSYHFSGASSFVRIDTTQYDVGNPGTADYTSPLVGDDPTGGNAAHMYMMEFIWYGADESVTDNETGLNTKWL